MWKNLKIMLVLTIFCLVHYGTALPITDPVVESNVGIIRGLRADDGDYSMYMGIPYATVNYSNPFGVSLPHPGFNEVFEAYNDTAICPQVEEFNFTIAGTLECLNLNIYVPNSANSKNKLPVMVWIYGGQFSIGFSGRYMYGPRYLVRHDVILVTFNYRLGPYGFMCLDIPEVPGNQGLKDQQLALKWIRDNIDAFGGDSKNITVLGNSSGGTSTDFHLIYGKEKLFQKAVMESGNSLYPWTVTKSYPDAALRLSEYFGLGTTDVKEAVTFLSTIDSNLLIAASLNLNIFYRPCVEKEFPNVDRFIYDYPHNIAEPYFKNTSLLLGYNSMENFLMYTELPEDEEDINLYFFDLKKYFKFEDEDLSAMEETVKSYINKGKTAVSKMLEDTTASFYSDFFFYFSVLMTKQRSFSKGYKNIYAYRFSYSGKRNFSQYRLNMTYDRAWHADEVGYLFDISFMNKHPTPEDQLIIDRMTTMWTNFAKFGNPVPATTDLLPVQWPAVTKDTLYFLDIDSELNHYNDSIADSVHYWNSLRKRISKSN